MHRSQVMGELVPLRLLATPLVGRTSAAEVTLKAVEDTSLGDALRQLRGEVVVVDFWATY